MSWWLAGLDIQSTKKYNLAARWLLRQSGVVRQRGEEFDPAELEYQKEVKMPNAETGDDEIVTPEDPLSGINRLLRALEEMTGRTSLDKRGELRNVFYLELKRRSGERISEFATRFRGLIAEMKSEGVTIHDGELGWWFKQKLGLDPLRTQLLDTALAGAEDYSTIEREVLRLFKDLHSADPLHRRQGDGDQRAPLLNRFLSQQANASRPSSYAPSMASSAARSMRSNSSTASSGRLPSNTSYRKPFMQKQAMVSEAEEEIHVDEQANEPPGGDDEMEPQTLEEVLTTEAEVLAAELDEAAAQGVDADTLQEIEESVEAAAEAFLTMKEARSKLQEVRKDRGYGKAPSPASSSVANKVNLKKQSDRHPCFDCGLAGHWAGDPECQKPGQQLGRKKGKAVQKQVKVTEALNTEHTDEADPEHEVLVLRHQPQVLTDAFVSTVQNFHEPKEVNALGLALDKRLVGALDSACNRTCTGMDWLNSFLQRLRSTAPEEVIALVKCEPEKETFRFGNGGTQVSKERWRLPTMVGGAIICFWTSVVPVASLGLLLGRDFLEAVGAVMSFSRKALRCDHLDGKEIPLSQLTAGHYALHLLPSSWPGLGSQKWRRFGLDGILEVQSSFERWVHRRLKMVDGPRSSTSLGHDHFLAESSVKAGELVRNVLAPTFSGSVQALSMPRTSERGISSTTSSTTRSTSRSTTRSPLNGGRKQQARPNEPEHQQVAKNVAPPSRTVSMGSERCTAVGPAKALLAVLAAALSIFGHPGPLVAARSTTGGRWSCEQATPGHGLHDGPLRVQEPGGVHALARPTWHDDGLLRRPCVDGNDSCKSRQGVEEEGERRRFGRSQEGGPPGRTGREQGGTGSLAHRTSRWTSTTSRRPDQVGSSVERQGGPRGQRRNAQEQGPTHRSGLEREAYTCSQQGEIKSEANSHQSSRMDRGLQCRSGDRAVSRDGVLSTPHRHAQPVSDNPGPHGLGDPRASTTTSTGHAGGPLQFGEDGVKQLRLRRRDGSDAGTSSRCRLVPGGSIRAAVGCSLRGGERDVPDTGGEGSGPRSVNPYVIHQCLKPGVASLIGQAWDQHEADRRKISQEPKRIRHVLEAEFFKEMEAHMNDETFFQVIDLMPTFHESLVNEKTNGSDPRPFLAEVYTTAQHVSKVARDRGHAVGPALSLETGWNFLLASHRERAKKQLAQDKPFCLVLAFPCGPFSPLQHLNTKGKLSWPRRLEEGRVLMRFALELADMQLKAGRHCIIENPKPSAAWREPEMRKFLEEKNVHMAVFDQCRFGLKSVEGIPQRKSTLVASSSSKVIDMLNGMVCKRDHAHSPVIGGSRVTARAGIYPMGLAKAMVRGVEAQFEQDFGHEALAAEDVEEEVDRPDGALGYGEDSDDDEMKISPEEAKMNIPASVKLAIKRLHENTGHRSGRRLARALAIAGAPPEAVVAAKRHRCAVCEEKAPPKARRPASLPRPKDIGDQVHVDLLEVEDCQEQKYYVCHCTDAATRFQVAEVLPNKSTAAVIEFLSKRWVAMFGPPRVLVCDQGREFISWEMEEWASSMSIMLHHIAVQAPWQNGVAERSGGILKTILSAIVAAKSIVNRSEMEMALSEAIAAYNGDVDGESGCSPFQAAFGRQPRMIGDVLGGIQQRLGEHGLVESKPSLARQIAMREVAKLAMTRLHFSRGLRKAELARSRSTTMEAAPTPGSICYFYRPLRYNNKMSQSRKKLTLKRWHGPAMMVAMDGHASVFLSYKGQLTKCALEHVRLASTMEQIASGAWSEAIKEAVDAARHEQALRNPQSDGNQGWQAPQQPVLPETPVAAGNPSTPAFLPPSNATMNADENQLEGRDLPPVQPQELWQMMVPSNALASSQVDSSLPSRRASDFSDTPFPQATRLAMGRRPSGLPLASVRERVREIEGSLKRPAELDAEALREQGHEQGTPRAEASSSTPAEVTEETLVTEAVDVIKAELKKENLHPLRRAFLQAELDKQSPLNAEVPDHGTWHGKWSLPSRSEWLAHQKLGLSWPNGSQPDHEVQAVQANRKEFRWRTMSSEEKKAFAEAAEQAWSVWEENAAIEVLTQEESERVRRRLLANKEGSKILTPRYVFTDRHEGLRTALNPLPLKARARVIVPGYKDIFSYSLRKDAPTGSRVSQHLLFTFTASHSTPTTPREQKWRIMSADVKSAFLKGDAYVDGQRELFLENVKGEEPKLPFGSCLAKIRKGVFGLSDAPRQWYLRLNKSLQAAGWERTVFDFACWLKWSDDRKKLRGIIISHVDDLLLGGDSTAQESLLTIGKELGFGSVEYDDFVYCGKRIQMKPDGAISVSVKAYHDNLSPVEIPLSRRKTPEAELSESERRQLRAVLGSLQWLVAQVRFDQGYSLSTLQGEKPVIGTLQKANQLVKEFKRRPDFSLVFQALDLSKAGIMVVSDSSLGNVLREGGCEGDVLEKLYSQSAYFVIIGDHNLMNGREGCFNVVDARSHRLPRVCRSTYGAELMGVEEGMDMGIFCRGGLATFLGLPTGRRDSLKVMEEIPMVSITDAKDTYDRGNSDCPTYGAQKSMAFAVAWVRQTLNGYNSSLKWTATANMWVDAGTKAMPLDHMQEILAKGKWSYVYHQDYVKQNPKKKTPEKIGMTAELPGEPLDERSQMFQFVLKLSGQPGWHERPDMAVHVAYEAKSFRVPDGRFGANKYPVRSTFGKFDLEDGRSVWRQLEHGENLTELANRQKLLPRPAGCLISLFMSQAKKRLEQLRNHDHDMHG